MFTNLGIDNEPLLMVAWNKMSRSLPVVILMASSIWIRCWWCFCIIIHFNSSLFFNFFLLAPFCSPVLKPNLYSCLRQVNSLDEVFKTGRHPKNSIPRLTELSTRSRTILACARNWVLVLQSLRLQPAVLPILVQYFCVTCFENFPEQGLLWYKCLDNAFLETLFRAREAGLKWTSFWWKLIQ